ncbi:hypothetical protein [Vagococcus sp.]|uniref:hypothetical protein n=1 Tax=Vagococcus sp. TaxID=1933889 RepID=UPI002FC5F66A
MIQSINRTIDKVNKRIGVNMTLPTISKELLEFNEMTNTVTAVTCLSIGLLMSSKVLTGVGVVASIGASIAHIEKKKFV